MNRHYLTHPDPVEDCFACKVNSIQFNPTTSPKTVMESRWEKDMPAYYRLRMNGLQPPHIDGSAELESKASTQLEVSMGHAFTKEELPHAIKGMEMAREAREYASDNNLRQLVRPSDNDD